MRLFIFTDPHSASTRAACLRPVCPCALFRFHNPRLCRLAVCPFSPLHSTVHPFATICCGMLIVVDLNHCDHIVNMDGAVCVGELTGAPASVQQWFASKWQTMTKKARPTVKGSLPYTVHELP